MLYWKWSNWLWGVTSLLSNALDLILFKGKIMLYNVKVELDWRDLHGFTSADRSSDCGDSIEMGSLLPFFMPLWPNLCKALILSPVRQLTSHCCVHLLLLWPHPIAFCIECFCIQVRSYITLEEKCSASKTPTSVRAWWLGVCLHWLYQSLIITNGASN